MKKRSILLVLLLVSVPLLCFCATAKRAELQNISAPAVKPTEVKQKVSIEELKRSYDAAKTERERRDVCLRAIDEGAIYRGGPVSALDSIFGTRFGANLPRPGESNHGAVEFVPFVPSPNNAEAAAHVGWHLSVEYSTTGKIVNYYLTNLHK